MPEYSPVEGIDYMIDFYQVVGVPEDAAEADIKKAINKKQKEYHPDRLEGLAPEFKPRGEKMANLMNRARSILVDSENRAKYDALFNDWDGLVSSSGDPVISPALANRRKMALMSPEEFDQNLLKDDQRIEFHVHDTAERIAFLENMMDMLGDATTPELRKQYEDALLEQDRNFAIRLSMREELLGIENGVQKHQDRIAPGYNEKVTLSLETARVTTLEDARALALSGTAQKLAILSGDPTPEPSKELLDPTTIQLPHYFDKVAEQVQDLADKRAEIVQKRLDNMQVEYPAAELQTDFRPHLVLGFKDEGAYPWFAFNIDLENLNFDQIDLPEGFGEPLVRREYATVIEQGFNIVLVPVPDQIDLPAVINEGLTKYYQKYFGNNEETETPVTE